ncbi:MAG: hypothetical protein CYG60_07590 [Actinobacteria bacterium]|nr:MAG: hypothetical protein CYG60_07590 [Actinomycetota bacterium]
MPEEKKSLWDRVWIRMFGDRSRRSVRMEKVIGYVAHRLDEGARLDEAIQEEYVRRQTSPDEVEQILDDRRIVEAARRRMHRELGSKEMSPGGRPRRNSF